MKSRPWLIEQEENPVPTDARQTTFGPLSGQTTLICSLEIPFRSSPRHWGQSAANEAETMQTAQSEKISVTKEWWGIPEEVKRPNSR